MAGRSGLGNGGLQSGGTGAGGGAMAGQGQQQKQKQKQPGESWMNKRAEDDYQRALEYVVDKDFSLSECFPLSFFFFFFFLLLLWLAGLLLEVVCAGM